MKRIWNYRGADYRFDVSEKSCIKRITEALAVLSDGTLDAEYDAAQLSVRHCEMISDFFDTVFGCGKGREICGDVMSAEAYSAAYADFVMFVRREVADFCEISRRMEDALSQKCGADL
jgi:hypothetical protein